jgi:UDP:flavonoid glycosyltransferase YjiC (YdhE family)
MRVLLSTIGSRGDVQPVVALAPQHYDQHCWARRIHQLGIGTAPAPCAPTAESLASALERTLHPAVADRTRAVATFSARR